MSLRATEQNFTGDTTPITSYNSNKINLGSLMTKNSGILPEDNFVGPMPIAIARPMEESTPVPMMFPHIISINSTTDWIFLTENSTAATASRRVFLYEYNKVTNTYNRNGMITVNFPVISTTTRGFRAIRYLHTIGTVGVAAPTMVYNTGTVTAVVAGTVTGAGGASFSPSHVGLMMGFGSNDVTQINCWYPIISNTNGTTLVVSGITSAFAAGTAYVIADCVVTGSSTQFVTEGIAAGANTASAAGLTSGLGPRIGFGNTDPNQITQWYQIGKITDNTHINLLTSPGVIAPGTPYVIEELRFVWTMTTGSATGGLFLLKGVGFMDFTTAGNTFPTIATSTDNQRGVYWLCDNGSGAVQNQTANGCAIEGELNKQTHYVYVLDGTNTTNAKIFKYNLRATGTIVSGKMQLVGPTDIIITGTQAVTGTIPNISANNGIITTLLHGPGANNPYFYFVTTTRLYCVDVASITSGNGTFINTANERQEVPPGGIITFPATGGMVNVQNIDLLDRLIITTYGSGAGYRQYVTRYPDGNSTQNAPFDHIFGVDDKQQDQSYLSSEGAIHFNTGSQVLSLDVASNGIMHITRNGTTSALNQMYALPFGAHWSYAYTTSPSNHQRIITPSIATTGCVKFDQLLVLNEKYLGYGELRLSLEAYRVYYRTADIITDATSSWILLQQDGDLSSVTPADNIQFMFEFYTIGMTCLPARIFKVIVTYEDGLTDSHYQLSAGLSDITTKTITWRFSMPFGMTVPTLKVQLFNAETDVLLTSDTTLTIANGTWSKSIDDGNNWIAYNTSDKANDITYIRYTSTSGTTDDVRVRALLTQN